MHLKLAGTSYEARESPTSEAPLDATRRSLVVATIYGLWSVIGIALSLPATLFLFWPPSLKRRREWVTVGERARFKADSPEEVVFRRTRADGWKVLSEETTAWVVVRSDEALTVFAPQCTHLGCAYHWDEGSERFFCPYHSSLFDLNGRVLAGPATRPLDRYTARVNDGHIEIGPLQPHA